MIGSLIGGGLKIGGAIAGGISGAKSAAKQQRMLNQQKMQNQRWYDQRYNEDSTQRADAQAALTNMRNAMAERSQASAGAAAVMEEPTSRRQLRKRLRTPHSDRPRSR